MKSLFKLNLGFLGTNVPENTSDVLNIALIGEEYSGKTTFFKQLTSFYSPKNFEKLINRRGERRAVQAMIQVTLAVDRNSIVGNEMTAKARKALKKLRRRWIKVDSDEAEIEFGDLSADALQCIWSDETFVKAFENSMFFQPYGFVETILNCRDLEEISKEVHLILHKPTKGYNRVKFSVREQTTDAKIDEVQIFDISSKIKTKFQWKHYIEQPDVILFFCSSSSFTINKADGSGNSLLQDSLGMFKSTCENWTDDETKLIVILSKKDILEYRLNELNTSFPDIEEYDGAPTGAQKYDCKANIKYIKQLFIQIARADYSRLNEENLEIFSLNLLDDIEVQRLFNKIIQIRKHANLRSNNRSTLTKIIKNEASLFPRRGSFSLVGKRFTKSALARKLSDTGLDRRLSGPNQDSREHEDPRAFSRFDHLPKSVKECFGVIADVELQHAQEHEASQTAWQKLKHFWNVHSGKNSECNLKELDAKMLKRYKAAAYMVLRLDEGVSSIFKTHPLRGRGSMYVSVLAGCFSNLICQDDEVYSEPSISDSLLSQVFRSGTKTSIGLGSKFGSQSAPIRQRGHSIDSTKSAKSNAIESIESAISVYSDSIKEREERSVDSNSVEGSHESDSFCGEEGFSSLMNKVLAEHNYVEVDDFAVNLHSLKNILDHIRDSREEFVNKIWKARVFTANQMKMELSYSVTLIQSILAILHQIDSDVCLKKKNHFQISRLVGEMNYIKSRTPLTKAVYKQWVCSRDSMDSSISKRLHPMFVIKANLRLNASAAQYNVVEEKMFKLYHLKKIRQNLKRKGLENYV